MHAHSQIESADDAELIDVAAELLTLLADPTRLRIVLALARGELSVSKLAEIVDRAPAAVSQHLAKLRLARLVHTRHEGNRVHYSLVDEHPALLVREALRQAEHSTGLLPAPNEQRGAR